MPMTLMLGSAFRRFLVPLLVAWLACQALPVTATAGPAPSPGWTDAPELAKACPKTLGTLPFVGARRYDDPANGISAAYRNGTETATLYFYTGGYDDIPVDVETELVRTVFEASCNDVQEARKAGVYAKAHLKERGLETIALPWRDVKFHHAVFEIEAPARGNEPPARSVSHLYLGTMRGVFVKVRHTYPAAADTSASPRSLAPAMALAIYGTDLVIEGKSEAEFRRTEPYVRPVGRWLADNPRYPPDALSLEMVRFLSLWFTGTPYVKIIVDPGPLLPLMDDGVCDGSEFVTTMYTFGCGLHLLDQPAATSADVRLAGTQYLLRAYRKLVAGNGGEVDCEGLTPALEAETAGTLAAFLGD